MRGSPPGGVRVGRGGSRGCVFVRWRDILLRMLELPEIHRLNAFLLRFRQDAKHVDEFRVRSESGSDFELLIGIVTRVRRLTGAYLRLHKVGFAAEGEVLARSALEHAVTAQWSYLVDGGMERLAYSIHKSQGDILKALYEQTDDQDVQDRYVKHMATHGPGLGVPSISRNGGMLDQFNNPFLSLSYRVLSQRVHVSSSTFTDAFAMGDDGKTLEVVEAPTGEYHYESVSCLAASAMLVSWILARLEGNTAELSTLVSIANELSLPYRLDLALDAELRRFPDEVE